jgi:hypothetical protein
MSLLSSILPAGIGLSSVAFILCVGSAHVGLLSESLGDDQQRQVHSVLQQVTDHSLAVVHCSVLVLLDEQLVQACLHQVLHQSAVVSAHSLNTLAVHLVILGGLSPEETSISLLVHQQVGTVDLLEFKLDWLDEECADVLGCLLAQCHGLSNVINTEFDHD